MVYDEKKTRIVGSMPTTWSGHMKFAEWLMEYKKPEVVVELGVDYGFSTCCFALSGIGDIYAIDWFKGDEYTGYRDNYKHVKDHLEILGFKNVHLICKSFDDALIDWKLSIDILHIDGFHTYDAIKNDYTKWVNHLNDGGVVLMHDTCVNEFGVKDFFQEIDRPKLNFKNSHGLGIVSNDIKLLEVIKSKFGPLL